MSTRPCLDSTLTPPSNVFTHNLEQLGNSDVKQPRTLAEEKMASRVVLVVTVEV